MGPAIFNIPARDGVNLIRPHIQFDKRRGGDMGISLIAAQV